MIGTKCSVLRQDSLQVAKEDKRGVSLLLTVHYPRTHTYTEDNHMKFDEPFGPWMIIGFAGQLFFTLRFLVQWIASEKKGESVVPVSFWYYSIVGSTVLLVYSIHRGDPVFMIGLVFNSVVYSRNLVLIGKKKNQAG